MDLATWIQTVDKAVYISLSVNTLLKVMNSSLLSTLRNRQIEHFSLDTVTNLREGKHWIQTHCRYWVNIYYFCFIIVVTFSVWNLYANVTTIMGQSNIILFLKGFCFCDSKFRNEHEFC